MAKANLEDPIIPQDRRRTNEDDFFKGMFEDFQSTMGESMNTDAFNPDAVIDGMMEQLLSKELMYEPMKQVTEKFPKWLEDQKCTISPEEYKQ